VPNLYIITPQGSYAEGIYVPTKGLTSSLFT